jgi:hypothetical protein
MIGKGQQRRISLREKVRGNGGVMFKKRSVYAACNCSIISRAIELNKKVHSIASHILLTPERLLRIQSSIRNEKEENHTTERSNNVGEEGYY